MGVCRLPQVPKPDVMLTTHEVVAGEPLGETLQGIQWDVMLLDQVGGVRMSNNECVSACTSSSVHCEQWKSPGRDEV